MSQSGSFRQAGPIPPGTDVQTITGNTGGAVPPTLGNIFLINANTTVNIAGNPGISTLLQDFGLSNLILGSDALGITIGVQNVGLGLNALNAVTSGSENTAIGYEALENNTTGSQNVAVGASALNAATIAIGNVAIGADALTLATSGSGNVAVGLQALSVLTIGQDNIGIGDGALSALTTGDTNIAIGLNAGSAYTTESDNILIGNFTGTVADAGVIRIGSSPPISSCFVAGIYNEPVGGVNAVVFIDNTGKLGTTGGSGGSTFATTYQADVGSATPAAAIININGAHNINTTGAGNTITIAVNNTATLGDLAIITSGNPSLTLASGDLVLSGTGLNAAGNIVLPDPVDNTGRLGVINIAGNRFLHSGNAGISSNVFLGRLAGNFTQTGIGNIGIGFTALDAITTGADNICSGSQAGTNITTGSDNISVGTASLLTLATGNGNISIGSNSLFSIINGSSNIAIGENAGSNYTGAESDNIVIGNQGTLGDNAAIRIGTNGTQTTAFMSGIAGVITANTEIVTIDTVTGQLGSSATVAPIQGTWTPVLRFGGASVGITYATQLGTYTRIGNQVSYAFNIVLTSKGVSVGAATISGFPVAAGALDLRYPTAFNFSRIGFLFAPEDQGCYLQTDIFNLIHQATGAAITPILDTNFVDTSELYGAGIMIVD